jgi:membrane-associated phospholipid phosphatase
LKNLVLSLFCLLSLAANAQQPDTTRHAKDNPVKAASFILPAALITYGSLSFAVHPVRRFDYYVNDQFEPGIKTTAATYLLFTPIVAVYGLNLAGIPGKHDFADRTALIALSAAFAGIGDYSLKHLVHRYDPGGTNPASFPSGHTIGAFAAAGFLSQEYGDQSPAYTIAGYTVALTTGALRLYTHNHWVSDIATGAGIGILSTKLAYLVYPSIKQWLTHADKTGRSAFVMPTYQGGMAGLNFSANF